MNDTRPLAIYQSCLEKFQDLDTGLMKDTGLICASFRRMLQLERQRFSEWGQSTGLGLDRQQLRRQLNPLEIVRSLETMMGALHEATRSLPSVDWTKPFTWNESAGYHSAFKGSARRVASANDELVHLLPTENACVLQTHTYQLKLDSLVAATKVEELEILATAAGEFGSDVDLQLKADCKRVHALLAQLENQGGGILRAALRDSNSLKKYSLPVVRTRNIRNLRTFDDEEMMAKAGRQIRRYLVTYGYGTLPAVTMLLEYKYYSTDLSGPDSETVFDRMHELATCLHLEKPATFRVLRCEGIFEEAVKSRFGLISRIPGNSNEFGPYSLLSYLNTSWLPSLSSRIALAKDLARTLSEVHSVGWLHTNLRSENVLFFPQQGGSRRTLESPYLVGFEYSRLDGAAEFSEEIPPDPEADMYRHPSCQRAPSSRFHKLHDYYSLGVVMVEIARWRPIRHVLRGHIDITDNITTDQIQKTKDILLSETSKDCILLDVEFRMGSIYKDAMYHCLKGDFVGDLKDNSKLQNAFTERVVQPLERCVI